MTSARSNDAPSAVSEDTEATIVAMEDLLLDAYRAIEELDERMHATRDELRSKLYAIRVRTNPAFRAAIADDERRIASGQGFDDDLIDPKWARELFRAHH